MKRLIGLLVLALCTPPALAADWASVLDQARGQTVYWNAWAGDERINDYIAWVGDTVRARYGVTVEHVKVTDTAEVVARILAEKSAGRDTGGSVDLVWINGENFAAMKRNGLLYPPWTQDLPNYSLVDIEGKPTTTLDFTLPVNHQEAPWGMAQLVFMYDTALVDDPPRSIPALLEWAEANPGLFTYPQPPDFTGSTFLKQALYELLPDDPALLLQPVPETETFDRLTAPLWAYLDQLHPLLWRRGRAFPHNGPDQRRLLADGEIDISMSFQQTEASAAIARGELPPTVRTFVLDQGTIGNTHFVAIPYNASAPEGAMVVADFLLSPEAQARKLDPDYWGDFTVLELDALPPDQRALFDDIELGVATLPPEALGTPLPEPHPSWMERLEQAWQRRYGAG